MSVKKEDEEEVEEDGDVPQLHLDPADPGNDSESDPDVNPTGSGTVPESAVPVTLVIDVTAPPAETIAPLKAGSSSLIRSWQAPLS